MKKIEYTGRQIKKIWKIHNTFCRCEICSLKHTLHEINNIVKMPDDEVILTMYSEC
jgi:hypothetical protein